MNNKKYLNENYNKKFICIEGNIGSGKSTFIKKLSNSLNFNIVPEPTDKWQNISGNNALNEFYKDTKRWAYSFQTYVFLTRIQAIEDELKKPLNISNEVFFVERSVFADRYVFAKACYENGSINELEWNMYCSWHEWMILNHTPNPSAFIYLNTKTNTTYSRIKKRARFEEESISIEYINLLEENHHKWLIEKINVYKFLEDIPVLVLDCNDDFQYNEKNWNKLLENVNSFILETIYNNFNIINNGENNVKRCC